MKASVMAPSGAVKKAFQSLLAVVKAERGKPVFLHVEDGQLVIEIVGTAALVPVVGQWDTRVRVPANAIPFWADAPIPGEFVHIVAEKGEVRFGGHSVTCEETVPMEPLEDLPVSPSFGRLMELGRARDRRTLENAGLWNDLCMAREHLRSVVDWGLYGQNRASPFPSTEVEAYVDFLTGKVTAV